MFWALRGGGGNFGVVTTFEYRLHPVAEIYGGPIAYRPTVPTRSCASIASTSPNVGAMPYPALNTAFDALLSAGLQHYWKASFARELSDDAIAVHVDHGGRVPAIQCAVHLYPINGAVQRVGADDTAFAYRDMNFSPVIAGMWDNPADNDANIAWVRGYYDALQPYSAEGGYINFMDGDDQNRIRANYRGHYERLAAIKATYDPNNVFHLNQNIQPSPRS